MQEMEFGRLIEKIIQFSGQKNYSLAVELGYDVSYISKWVNSTMLPTVKNIKNICNITANFVVNSATESSKDEILNYFDVSIDKSDDKNKILKETIEEKLNDAYIYSYNKYNKKSYNKDNSELNGIIDINPRLRKRHLEKELSSFLQGTDKPDIFILCDLFSLNKEDKVNIAGFRKGVSSEFKNGKIRFLISFDDTVDDVIFNIELFLRMLTSSNKAEFELYSCDFSANTLILVVKDKCFHSAIYDKTNKCLFTSTSTDNAVIDEMYDTLDEMANTQSRSTFSELTPEEMILSQNYMSYVMGKDLKWLMGNMNQLLMPSDLFFEIGESVFGNYPNVLSRLKRIDAILQNATYNSEIDILLYQSALEKYVINGEANFFNIPVKLTINQRERHLAYIQELLERENIRFKTIENSLVEDFKKDENTSVYLSKNISFLKVDANNKDNDYLIVKDKNLSKIFDTFYEEIWTNRKDVVQEDIEENKKIISDCLNYTRILSNNMEFYRK